MFPVLRVSVHGLDPETLYDLKLDFLPCDNYRWRYVSSRWQTNGKQDHTNLNPDRHYGVTARGEPYSHPKSPNYGRFWMSDVVEFKNVKLTNRPNPIKDDHVEHDLCIEKSMETICSSRSFSIHCININQGYISINRYPMVNRMYF